MKHIKGNTQITDRNTYTFRIKEKSKYRWLWLLLFLPFIFLIPLTKKIKLKVIDSVSAEILVGEEILFQYRKRDLFSFDSMAFFGDNLISTPPMKDISDSLGFVEYETGYSVYQWTTSLFMTGDTARAWSEDLNCHYTDSTYDYHNLKNGGINNLFSVPKYAQRTLLVVDADDNNEPLPDARVVIQSKQYHLLDSGLTDASGRITFNNVPVCANIRAFADKYGWYPDSLSSINGGNKIDTLFLRQEKEIVKFYVHEVRLKEPIVGILGHLCFEGDKNKEVATAKTNINGVAKGVFEKVHRIKNMNIHANKDYKFGGYSDTLSVDSHGWKQVSAWNQQNDEQKILYLRRTKLNFETVEKNNLNKLIPNVPLIVEIDGKVINLPKDSGNGRFTIDLPAGADKITIRTKKPCYTESPFTVDNLSISELFRKNEEYTTIPLKKTARIVMEKCFNINRPDVNLYVDGAFVRRLRTTTAAINGTTNGSFSGSTDITQNLSAGNHEFKFVIADSSKSPICSGCSVVNMLCNSQSFNLKERGTSIFIIKVP